MKVTKLLVLSLLLIVVSACGGSKEEKTNAVCTIKSGGSEQSIEIYDNKGKVEKLALKTSLETDKENADALDKEFESAYSNFKGVSVDSDYKDGFYHLTLTIELSKLDEEQRSQIYMILGVAEEDEKDKLIKAFEEADYTCK